MVQENACLIKTTMEQQYIRAMEREDALHVQVLEKLKVRRVAYVMEAENVGVAMEPENAQDVKAQVGQ